MSSSDWAVSPVRYLAFPDLRAQLLQLVSRGEFDPFLGLYAGASCRLAGALGHATFVCRCSGMSDRRLAPGLVLGGSGALVHLRGRSVQKRREALCGLSDVVRCSPGGASSLRLYGATPTLGGLTLDRRALPERCRLVALQCLFSATPPRYLVPMDTSDSVTLIGTTFAPIRCILSAIGDLLPIVRNAIPIVGCPLTLGRRLHAREDRHCLFVIEPMLVPQPGALVLQRLIIGAKLRRPVSNPHRPTLDLIPFSHVTLL